MKKYWKVHISEFDNFVDFILARFEGLDADPREYFRYYDSSDTINMYITDDVSLIYGTNVYNLLLNQTHFLFVAVGDQRRMDWLDEWQYMGEYNLRKRKLERINSL